MSLTGCPKYPREMSSPPRSFVSHRLAAVRPVQDDAGLREAEVVEADFAKSQEQRRPHALAASPKAGSISLSKVFYNNYGPCYRTIT